MAANEETPLLHAHEAEHKTKSDRVRAKFALYGSFLGILLAAADDSLVITTWSVIASDFHRLSQGSWLLAAYNFGWCVSLPVYGTLCELHGPKNILLTAYTIFAAGCLACGLSTSLVQLVLARVLAGMGAGGMVSLVSIILTDMVTPDEVAVLRGYANVSNVVGRSLGAPLGGYLIGAVGWRWSFLGQIPVVAICLLIGLYGLPSSFNSAKSGDVTDEGGARRSGITRFDFSGLVSFAIAIILLLFLVQDLSAAPDYLLAPPSILVPAFSAAVILFVAIEAYWAHNPLIPLHLVKTSLGGFCLNQALMMSSRVGLLSNLTPYMIRVKNATDAFASTAYVLSAVGVSFGALIAGKVIKRSKRYRTMTVIAVGGAIVTYLLIFIRWRTGCYLWELVYLFPNGMAIGILFTTQFIGMSLDVPKEHLSTCITTYYLFQQLGNVVGPSTNVAIVQRVFLGQLKKNLNGWDEQKFIGQIINENRFAQRLSLPVRQIVRWSYLNAFQWVPLISAACALLMLPTVLWVKEQKIE
ncbi:hypothetical protein ETB97_008439 [Aspergillus alliaceus]|uniref:Major facilitator superfamily (MFS) profile domain-containing protein n=1 Tax=Petromyces alliaceus TaxID=209559 RepID=A0A8H5ZXN7_PETAA|nr:hypothetical protein ETB97_008439 [Aspergillus burnettii]